MLTSPTSSFTTNTATTPASPSHCPASPKARLPRRLSASSATWSDRSTARLSRISCDLRRRNRGRAISNVCCLPRTPGQLAEDPSPETIEERARKLEHGGEGHEGLRDDRAASRRALGEPVDLIVEHQQLEVH